MKQLCAPSALACLLTASFSGACTAPRNQHIGYLKDGVIVNQHGRQLEAESSALMPDKLVASDGTTYTRLPLGAECGSMGEMPILFGKLEYYKTGIVNDYPRWLK